MNYPVQPQEAARIKDQISRVEAEFSSYDKEIPRLKRILAACPPPNCNLKASVSSGKRETLSSIFSSLIIVLGRV
jgi:hypothetical protein